MRTGERRRRLPNWAIGLVLVVILAIASVYAFTKAVPWANPHTVQAVFPNAGVVRPNSPVRIAGVNVGKVTKIEHLEPEDAAELSAQAGTSDSPVASPPSSATVVTMELDDSALPLHTDATMKLRPRLFLEGNLFVDLKSGTPGSDEADDGYVFPISQTSIAVSIDQVFTTLQADVRSNLQTLLDELGTAFRSGGAEGFREIYRTSPGAFRYTAEVNEAFLGTEPHDLSELIVNLDTAIEALNQGKDLQDLVTNLKTVLGSFAAESQNLEDAIGILPDVLRVGEPALASLDSSLPALRAFSREALPGVRSTPETLDAATPLLAQVRGLVSEDELRGLVSDLRPTIPRLAKLSRETIGVMNQTRALSSCFNEVIIPFGHDDTPSRDDTNTPTLVDPTDPDSHAKVYEELTYGLSGISGESRSGDANGPYIRVMAGGGPNTVVLPQAFQEEAGPAEDAIGVTSAPLVGAIPAIDDSAKTPYRPDVRCETQETPDLDATSVDLGGLNQPRAPIPQVSATPELVEGAEELSSLYEEATDASPGKAQRLYGDTLDVQDDLAEALAEQLGWEHLLDDESGSP